MTLNLKNTNIIKIKAQFRKVIKILVKQQYPFGKQDFKYFVVAKVLKKLDLGSYSVHKWLYIKEILIKTDVFIF